MLTKHLEIYTSRCYGYFRTFILPLWPHGYSMRLFTYGYGRSVWDVTGLCLNRGAIVGGVFLSSQATGKVFSAKCAIYSEF